MSFSYDTGLSSNRDKVRFKIGDTDSNRELLSNEEIDAVLAIKAAVSPASLDCVDAILAKIARDVDRNAAGVTSSRSQAYNHYLELRKKLAQEMITESEMFVGGLSKADKRTFEADSDFVRPSFGVGQFDNKSAADAEDCSS